MAKQPNTLNIVLMGVQGAGKGTQAPALAECYHIPHVTTGGMFRENTPLAREVQDIITAGHLVPDETVIAVVKARLRKPDAVNGVILDGFPRTLPQAEALEEMLAQLDRKVTVAPFLNLKREEAIRRISSRWVCSEDSNHVYNVLTNPPRVRGSCDIDGAELTQRRDDTPEAAAKRIDDFYQKTMPLLDFYKARGLLMDIDANQPIQKVTDELIERINALIQAK